MKPRFHIAVRVLLLAFAATTLILDSSPADAKKRTKRSKTAKPKKSTPEPLGDALRGEAKEEYEQAGNVFRTGDFGGALRRYQKAYELQSDPRLLWNIAVCEKQLRHYAKVPPLVDAFLEKAADLVTAEEKRTAIEFAKAVHALIGEITFTCTEPSIEIFIDEERMESACERPVSLEGGDHRLRAVAPGFKELSEELTVPSGGARTVSIVLETEKKEARLAVTAKPDGIISLDGKGVGRDAWSGMVPPGKHALLVTASGKKDYHVEIDLADKEDRNVIVALEEEPSSVPVWLLVAGGVVLVAGAVAGGYFLFRPTTTDPVAGTLGTHVLQ
jgi:hypothetical protein